MKVKNIVSLILGVIFAGLIGYGLWVFAASYFTNANNNKGFLDVSGRIEGREYHASSKISGRVDEIFVDEGQKVKEGDVIAKIYSKALIAMVEQAQANLNKAKANLNLAELDYQRYERLLKEEAVAKADFDNVQNKYILAKEEAVSAQKEIERLNADLDDSKIFAPKGGTVISKIVQSGEVISAGTPIVAIINMDELYLKVFLPTESAGKINLGLPAKIFADALSNESFEAVVDKISEKAEFTPKNVETKSQRAKLVFEIKLKVLSNSGYKLKPGMPAEALIKVDENLSWDLYKRKK